MKARWRTGGEYELTVLLDFEAWLLQGSNTSDLLLSKLGKLEREIEEFRRTLGYED